VTAPAACMVQIQEQNFKVVENGVNINLTLIDTPGFGDAIDNSNWLTIFTLCLKKT
jgi:septin family protein